MNTPTLLTLGLLSLTPSALFAQSYPEPLVPVVAVPQMPKPARAPRVPLTPQPAIAAFPETTLLPPEPAEAPQTPKPAPAPIPVVLATPAAPLVAPAPPRPPGQLLNVQVEVTLSDSKGKPKTVVLTVADGEMGQNRTGSSLQLIPGGSYSNFGFNADARPSITGNKIRLYLSAEASVPSIDAKGSAADISLRQSQTLILNDGDSVEIARATDPVSDRAFALSVKVKIQR